MQKRILTIEDDTILLKLFGVVFPKLGYEVETAPDGMTGFVHFQQENFHGITLGIMMPGMTGVEVLRRIRHINHTIPVIMISGGYWFLKKDELRFLLANAQNLLVKPFSFMEFKETVDRCFGPPECL